MSPFKKILSLLLLAGFLLPQLSSQAQVSRVPKVPRHESSTTPEVERKPIPIRESEQLVPGQKMDAPDTNAEVISTQALITSSNLIPNPDLESAGSNGLPTSWYKGGFGSNTRILTYPVPGSSGNGIKINVTNYVSGDIKWYFDHTTVTPGSTYRFQDKYKSTAQSIVTIQYKMSNGTFTYKDIAFLGPTSSFAQVTQDFVVPQGVISLTVFHLLKSNGELITDEYNLTKLSTTGDAIVPNGGFEEGVSAPTFWSQGKWGTNTTTFSYPVTGFGEGKAVRVTMASRVSGDAKWNFAPITLSPGTYTYKDNYISSVPTVVTVEFTNSNGSKTYQDIAQVPASSAWNSVSATFTVPSSATKVTVFHLINRNGSLTIDNVSIESGNTSTRPGIFATGAVTIRLDDNWLSQYQNAFPILDNAGFDATLYVASQQIFENGFPGYMSVAQIREVYLDGHEIGAHTRTHRDLVTLSQADKISEIQGSRSDILSWNVGPVLSFAYPFGSYNAEVLQIVKDSGFESSASSNGGLVTPASDPYQLERRGLEINTTFAEAKSWIDQAGTEKNWLILSVHEVKPTCQDRYCVTNTTFSQIINYLKTKGLPVVTISEGIQSVQ